MDIKKLVENEKLLSILDTYGNHSGQMIGEMYKKSINANMIVPVLGMQGMGKSTLINSILGKNILPSDADETTCVPVEVKYGKEEFAKVYFKNSDEETLIHTREELNAYVDNNENPANKKQVSKIVLFDSLELLKTGLVIVDLPGVGSLTNENAETTNEYIKNLCTAIFVIPTTPTIRRQEVVFIKAVWSQFPTAIFVQNHWDENERELDESVEYNNLILKKIAKEINVKYEDNIIVVDAYNALKGRIKDDEIIIKESNLFSLMQSITDFSLEWKIRLQRDLSYRLVETIKDVKSVIDNNICEMELAHKDLINKRTRELDEFLEKSKVIKKKIREVENFLDEKDCEVREKAKKASSYCASNIRKDVFMLVDKGITDGQQLKDAFSHYQEEYVTEAFDSMFSYFMEIKMELEQMLNDLANVSLENNMKCENEVFDKNSQFKFEKSFGTISGIAGGLAGLWAISSIGGPAGWIVAAGISIAALAISGIAKKSVRDERGAQTKKELESVIDKIQKTLYDTLIDGFDDVYKSVSAVLENIKIDRKKEEERRREIIFEKYENNNDLDKKKMEEALAYLSDIEKEIELHE